jgi:hypothetical protein
MNGSVLPEDTLIARQKQLTAGKSVCDPVQRRQYFPFWDKGTLIEN